MRFKLDECVEKIHPVFQSTKANYGCRLGPESIWPMEKTEKKKAKGPVLIIFKELSKRKGKSASCTLLYFLMLKFPLEKFVGSKICNCAFLLYYAFFGGWVVV
jgi:hypothetical protein